jgi:hypothetical protein
MRPPLPCPPESTQHRASFRSPPTCGVAESTIFARRRHRMGRGAYSAAVGGRRRRQRSHRVEEEAEEGSVCRDGDGCCTCVGKSLACGSGDSSGSGRINVQSQHAVRILGSFKDSTTTTRGRERATRCVVHSGGLAGAAGGIARVQLVTRCRPHGPVRGGVPAGH